MYKGFVTDIEGILVGHNQDYDALTGTSVVIAKEAACCGVDVRGSAPGTRETDLLKAENLVEKVNAVMLSGGSAYGLDAASGIMEFLEKNDMGMDVQVCKVPIVTGAVVFDLAVGNPMVRPDKKMGYQACAHATDNDTSQGCIGGGTGASVGKILGNDFSMKSGIGQACIEVGDFKIAALTVLNAFGDIYDYEKGKKIAGVYDKKNNKFLDTLEILKEKTSNFDAFSGKNTTIAIVVTNGNFSKAQCNKLAQMAHDGFARSIEPVHTMFDGDTIFSMATGMIDFDLSLAGSLAARVISRSIANAIYSSESKGGLIAYKDINFKK